MDNMHLFANIGKYDTALQIYMLYFEIFSARFNVNCPEHGLIVFWYYCKEYLMWSIAPSNFQLHPQRCTSWYRFAPGCNFPSSMMIGDSRFLSW